MTIRAAITILLCVVLAFLARAEDAPAPLEKNPFVRPAFLSDRAPPPVVTDETDTAQPLSLRGVLLSGKTSLVNVDGQIVGLGEEVAGFRLERVEETYAVFSKDGQEVPIPLPGSAGPDGDTPAGIGNDDV